VQWIHQDPATKSQRLTDARGTIQSWVDLDPWGAETKNSFISGLHPQRYTSYQRDVNNGDDAMMRRYESQWQRFSQPDPHDGSYDLTDPQSFNRYAYTQNDPVNILDPSGLTCALRLSLTSNKLLDTDQLEAMEDEISRIFNSANINVEFVRNNPHHWLNVNTDASTYASKPSAVGITPLTASGTVGNFGRVFIDRLTSSATSNPAAGTSQFHRTSSLVQDLQSPHVTICSDRDQYYIALSKEWLILQLSWRRSRLGTLLLLALLSGLGDHFLYRAHTR
jgi:RHS repeat-associated protein